jgi:hypothetical protein
MTTFDSPDPTFCFAEKFQSFYQQFTEFTHDVAHLQNNMPVHDDASRALFGSLSRLMAFSDQMNLLLQLMREDVRVIEELSADPMTGAWSEQIEHCFYEWLKASRTSALKVN